MSLMGMGNSHSLLLLLLSCGGAVVGTGTGVEGATEADMARIEQMRPRHYD